MDNQQNVNADAANSAEQPNFPSIHAITCPKCHAGDLKIMGVKGAKGAVVGMALAFGAVGGLIANAASKDNMALYPTKYRCKSCGNKFESLPLVAQPEELLNAPCTIKLRRKSGFVGMAVSQDVWMNGVKVGTIGNGKTISFQSFTKHNTLFLIDQYGTASKNEYKFEAQAGGNVEVTCKLRKFV